MPLICIYFDPRLKYIQQYNQFFPYNSSTILLTMLANSNNKKAPLEKVKVLV